MIGSNFVLLIVRIRIDSSEWQLSENLMTFSATRLIQALKSRNIFTCCNGSFCFLPIGLQKKKINQRVYETFLDLCHWHNLWHLCFSIKIALPHQTILYKVPFLIAAIALYPWIILLPLTYSPLLIMIISLITIPK